MLRKAAAVIAVAVGSLMFAPPASAAPNEQITGTCDGIGEVTVTVSGGAAFWIGGAVYLPLRFQVSNADGIVFEKSYGNRTGLTDMIRCGTEPNELGFQFEVTAVRVPPLS